MEVGAQDFQGLPPLTQPAPRLSYAPMAGKLVPSSHKSLSQWNQAPVTLIYHWKNKGGGDEGKRMIQMLNEESGRHEHVPGIHLRKPGFTLRILVAGERGNVTG